jgi:hypothetical protein
VFTSRSGAAHRAARTVVAERRSAAPPWRRAGARTRGPRSGRRAAGRGSRDRPGTVPQAGTGAGYLTGTRTREVTSQSRCAFSIRRGRRRPSPASRSGPRLSTCAAARPQFRLGGSAGRPPAPTVRAWTDGARHRPRDAVGGSTHGGRRSGWRPGWCGQPPSSSPSVRGRGPHPEQRSAHRPRSSRPGCRPNGRAGPYRREASEGRPPAGTPGPWTGRRGRRRRSRCRSGSRRTASVRDTGGSTSPRRWAPRCASPRRARLSSPACSRAAGWCRCSTRTGCGPPMSRWSRSSRPGRRSGPAPCSARSPPGTGAAVRRACTGGCAVDAGATWIRCC